MTLAERRVVHDFETNELPALQARVDKAAGFALPLEILWDTLVVEGESRLYMECWPAIYFKPLIAALEALGRDDMGRQALRDGLKKVVVQKTKGCIYGDCWATLLNGVLTLDHESLTNAHDVDDRAKGLISVLEKGL